MQHTLTFPFRKICSALPAVALLSGGVVLSASAAPLFATPSGVTSSGSPAIVVPDIALTLPGAPAVVGNSLHLAAPATLAPNQPLAPHRPALSAADPAALNAAASSSLAPAGAAVSTPVTLNSAGIPARALDSYRVAAALLNEADPGCKIDWALVAAIGKVESDHARFGGNQLDSRAVAQPGIIGIALDGTNGTARITDTDGGQWDGDTTFDRAVGPMQFIPGTWRAAGVDADGDGAMNPQDMDDAATGTAIYLCSGSGDLSTAGALRSSILRYNQSDSYARLVTSIAASYRLGVSALPAPDLPGAAISTKSSEASAPSASSPVRNAAAGQRAESTPRALASTKTSTPAPRPTTRTPAAKPTARKPAPKPTTNTPAPKPTTRTPAPKPTTNTPAPRTTTPAPRTTTTPPAPRTTTPAPRTTTTPPAPRTTTPAPTTPTTDSTSRRSGDWSSSRTGGTRRW